MLVVLTEEEEEDIVLLLIVGNELCFNIGEVGNGCCSCSCSCRCSIVVVVVFEGVDKLELSSLPPLLLIVGVWEVDIMDYASGV